VIQRALASQGLVAYVLACATGITLYFRWPFPENNLMLNLISIRAPLIYAGFKYTYTVFLFTTPYIGYLLVLSGLYVFEFRPTRRIKPMPLPAYPEPSRRDELFLVLEEVHDPRKPVAAEQPCWLAVHERGLFIGIAIFGTIGTGKAGGCMYPYAEHLIAYEADDREKYIGGLVLKVKGDFCHKVKDILKRHGREADYVEVNLNADYRYNPTHNNLDAYALAHNIASLLNNLFGKGKEPFWQQEGVKRWFYNGWRGSRTSCALPSSKASPYSCPCSMTTRWSNGPAPPKESYDPKLNADDKYGRLLPPFADLIKAGKVCALNFPVSLNPVPAIAFDLLLARWTRLEDEFLDLQSVGLYRVCKACSGKPLSNHETEEGPVCQTFPVSQSRRSPRRVWVLKMCISHWTSNHT
jgi:hypothetical protein